MTETKKGILALILADFENAITASARLSVLAIFGAEVVVAPIAAAAAAVVVVMVDVFATIAMSAAAAA